MTVLATAGCTPAATASAATGSDHSLTFAQAEKAYGCYLAASKAAAVRGNATKGEAQAGYAQWYIVRSQYTALATAHTPVPRYRYGRPVFYVPALTGYPQWFMVAVPRSTDTGGRLGPAANTLMVFARAGKTLPWTLSGTAVLGQPLPAIARDSDGYAVDVATADPSLLLRPGSTRRRTPRPPRSRPGACSTSGCWRERPSRSSHCA